VAEWSLQYPWALALIVLYALCERFCRAKTQQLLFPDTALLQKLSHTSGWVQRGLKLFIFILLAVALASPIRQNSVVIQNDKGYQIALILDASGSMRENNKFGIVKQIVQDFIDKRTHDQLGLTIFADFAYVAMPLTYDKKSLKQLISKINVGIAGMQHTALYEALFMSTDLFKDSHAKQKIAILLTDGVDNASTVPLDVAIQSAVKHGIKVYTIGVGGGNGGDFNPAVLQKIAKGTGGIFYQADSVARLKQIYRQIDSLEKSDIKAKRYVKKQYYFPYPLAAAALLLILFALIRRRGYAL
jgi:Ca-activated chloride channel homolog